MNIKNKETSQQASQQSANAAKYPYDFISRLKRIQSAIGVTNNSGIAKALGIKQPSVAGAIKRKQIPPSWFVKIAEDYGISADWLLFGEGISTRDERKSQQRPLIEADQQEIVQVIQKLLSAHELLLTFADKDNKRIPLSEFENIKLKTMIEKDAWVKLKEAIWATTNLLMRMFPLG